MAQGRAGPRRDGGLHALSRDFNGDGKADILWRGTSGAVAISLIDGLAVVGTAVLGTLGADWTIVRGFLCGGCIKPGNSSGPIGTIFHS